MPTQNTNLNPKLKVRGIFENIEKGYMKLGHEYIDLIMEVLNIKKEDCSEKEWEQVFQFIAKKRGYTFNKNLPKYLRGLTFKQMALTLAIDYEDGPHLPSPKTEADKEVARVYAKRRLS